MNKSKFVKKTILILILATVIAVFAIYFFKSLTDDGKKNGVGIIKKKIEDIVPGTTLKNELFNILGEPISTTQIKDTQTQYEFRSTSDYRNNQAVINDEDETVTIVKEIITSKNDKTSSSIQQEYGLSEIKLSKPDSGSYTVPSYLLYAYPSKGIAYIGHVEAETILEIWYFESTTNDVFVEKWAPDYTVTTD